MDYNAIEVVTLPLEGEKLLVIGFGIGIGIALAFILSRRNSYVEIVRDEQGNIVQILEMNDVQPIIGRRMLNVNKPKKLIGAKIVSEP